MLGDWLPQVSHIRDTKMTYPVIFLWLLIVGASAWNLVPLDRQPNRPCNKNLTPQIQNANITGVRLPSASNTKYKVYYECKHGFRRIGKDHVTCKRSGQWGRVMIQCTPYPCPERVHPANGTRKYGPDNRTVVFDCSESFFLTGGEGYSTCLPTHQEATWDWDSTQPNCRLKGLGCLPPSFDVEDGWSEVVSPDFELGSNVIVGCWSNMPTKLIGPAVRYCQDTGRWNTPPARCVRHDPHRCANPGVPDGAVKRGTVYHEGAVVSFRCPGDPVLVGSPQRKCMANRRWSGYQPHCHAPDVRDPRADGPLLRQLVDTWSEETISSVLLQRKILRDRSQNVSLGHEGGYGGRPQTRSDQYDGLDLYLVLDNAVLRTSLHETIKLAMTIVKLLGLSAISELRGTKVAIVTFDHEYDVILQTNQSELTTEVIAMLSTISATDRAGTMEAAVRGVRSAVRHTQTTYQTRRSKSVAVIVTRRSVDVSNQAVQLTAELHASPFNTEMVVIALDDGPPASEDLNLIISEPPRDHLFFVHPSDMAAFIGGLTDQLDYSACGHAGNTRLNEPSFILSRRNASRRAFPWTVAIYQEDFNTGFADKLSWPLVCGGSLVDERWVVTAAHCVSESRHSPHRFLVRLGTIVKPSLQYPARDLPATTQTVEVSQILVHESYDLETMANDVALLKLSTPVTYAPSVRPVCLPPASRRSSRRPEPGTVGVVTGWGHSGPVEDLLRPGSLLYESTMHQLEMNVRTHRECEMALELQNKTTTRYVYNKMFCAGVTAAEGGGHVVDSCRGDSGGPFAVLDDNTGTWILDGVVSFGFSCGINKKFGFYTRVEPYVLWIKSKQSSAIRGPGGG